MEHTCPQPRVTTQSVTRFKLSAQNVRLHAGIFDDEGMILFH